MPDWQSPIVPVFERLSRIRASQPWLGRVWIVAALAAAVWFLATHWNVFATQALWRPVALAFALTFAGKIFSAAQMPLALEQVGVRLGLRASLYPYSAADLPKYLPGGIWGAVSRAALYSDLGLPPAKTAFAMVMEQAWLIGGAAVFGLNYALLSHAWLSPLIGLVAAAAVTVLWFSVCYAICVRSVRSVRFIAQLAIVQFALWSLIGGGFAVLLPSSVPPLVAMGAFCLGFAGGLFAIIVPSGIGVREAIAIAILLPFQGAQDIAAELIFSRIVWVLADVAFAGIAIPLGRNAWRAAVAGAVI